jgi:hypothetical protein
MTDAKPDHERLRKIRDRLDRYDPSNLMSSINFEAPGDIAFLLGKLSESQAHIEALKRRDPFARPNGPTREERDAWHRVEAYGWAVTHLEEGVGRLEKSRKGEGDRDARIELGERIAAFHTVIRTLRNEIYEAEDLGSKLWMEREKGLGDGPS